MTPTKYGTTRRYEAGILPTLPPFGTQLLLFNFRRYPSLAGQPLVLAEAAGGAVAQLGRGGRAQHFGVLRDAHAAGGAAALGPAGVPPGMASRVDGG